jgi:hypothetical protein
VVTSKPDARLGLALPRLSSLAGLRWCGEWRRAHLRGPHDQAQIKDQGCYSAGTAKGQESQIPVTVGSGFFKSRWAHGMIATSYYD